ncbi:PREDICTED: uncharacterized protein LOC104609111 isoform X2 [Nelumbo nucifera]|uniref:Uncharacterized protein LOC104609111 isoform X2 n=1 Tax=Nelumbo nucifera TaxID=4432 RepID=A0A1U8QB19_NELNU|nr:PREDICTED: uncharacterized protein LOC104609111 isoform X2 [Nelumbo nucifera]
MALASSHPLSPQFLSTSFQTKLRKDHSHQLPIWFNTPRLRYCLRLPATRRFSNYSQESDNLVSEPRNWSGRIARDYDDFSTDDDADDDEEGEDEDRSLDLLVRFVQNVFRKISRRARKAVRSVLPLSISTKLLLSYRRHYFMCGLFG